MYYMSYKIELFRYSRLLLFAYKFFILNLYYYPLSIIVYVAEKGASQTIGKDAYALPPPKKKLLGYFSLSINLKTYAVHSAIKVFNAILYNLLNMGS